MALVAGVDVISGMGATMINITGDLVGAHLIDKSEKRISRKHATSTTKDNPLLRSSATHTGDGIDFAGREQVRDGRGIRF